MTTLTAQQIAALIIRAGFRKESTVAGQKLRVVAVAVCLQESGGRVEVVNSLGCVGLFQIRASVHPEFDRRKLGSDALYNVKSAKTLYDRSGWQPWEAFTSGAYKKHLATARQAVARAEAVVGSAPLPGGSPPGSTPAVTYGPKAAAQTYAGVGVPLAAAAENLSPLGPFKVIGAELTGDFSTAIIGTPHFEAGIETIPNLSFTIADPGGALLAKQGNLFVPGARVQYMDLDMRIDTVHFEPGSHGTGQIVITAIDHIAYALMGQTGAMTRHGISAVQWLHDEMFTAKLSPSHQLLGEAVVTQSEIARDVPDQAGTSSGADKPSSWTTQVRMAKELGKRFFISGTRVVFGSSAFAMQWCAPGPVRLHWQSATLSEGERWMTLPTAKSSSINNNKSVKTVTGRVPLNRAAYFRPGVPVDIYSTPAVAGATAQHYICSHVNFDVGIDVDGVDIELMQPIDPAPQPPTSGSANSRSTSSGSSVSGGGADGQVATFVALALKQAGKRYVFGAEASPSDPDPSKFDCSELVEWAAARAGISPRVPDGSAAQKSWCASHGTIISVAQGIRTKGALLFHPGHVAISLGNGKTIEAMNPSNGVRQGTASTSRFSSAGKIPGAKGYK